MNFSFKSHGLTDMDVFGHNDMDGGNPAGGYAACSGGHMETTAIMHETEHPTHFVIRWQDGPIDRDVGRIDATAALQN